MLRIYLFVFSILGSLLLASPKNISGEFLGPTDIAIEGNYAYVCNLVSASISVIDTQTNEIVKEVKHSEMRSPFSIATLNGYAYITNLNTHTISVLDTKSQTIVETLSEDILASHKIIAARIGHRAFAFLVDVGIIQVLDITSPQDPFLVQTLLHPHINGLGISIGSDPHYQVCVSASLPSGQGGVLAYSYQEGMYLQTPDVLKSPHSPQGSLLTNLVTINNTYAYVCDQMNDTVQVYDLIAKRYMTSIENIHTPVNLATDGQYVYVCNFGSYSSSNTTYDTPVSVIEIANHTLQTNLRGFYSPQALALTSEALYVINASNSQQPTGNVLGGTSTQRLFKSVPPFAATSPF